MRLDARGREADHTKVLPGDPLGQELDRVERRDDRGPVVRAVGSATGQRHSQRQGEQGDGEEALAAAQREFAEETGFAVTPPLLPLGELRQKSGKRIAAWAFEGDADPERLVSNLFELEWPPRSGRMQSFPEVDRVHWFGLEAARRKLIAGQAPFIAALERLLQGRADPAQA